MARRTILFPMAAAAIAASACAAPAATAGPRFTATNAHPVIVPLEAAEGAPAEDGGDAVIIAVRKFHPSSQGPVQILVEALCGGPGVEIGRFGVHPEREFAAGAGTEAKYYRFQLESAACPRRPEAVRVSIVPSLGNGADASIEVTGRLAGA